MLLYKQYDLQFKDVDAKQGIVTGYFSAFNNKDADGDIIRKGAYAATILKHGPDSSQPRIKHLLDHDKKHPVGRITVLKEDTTGLYYESKAGSHAAGRDFLAMAESGIITEHSVGIIPTKQKANPAEKYNEIFEVEMIEGSSLRFWGSNPNTPLLAVKSDKDLFEMLDLLEKALRTGTYTDETFLQIEEKHKAVIAAIQQRLKQIKPEPQPDENAVQLLKAFKDSINLN